MVGGRLGQELFVSYNSATHPEAVIYLGSGFCVSSTINTTTINTTTYESGPPRGGRLENILRIVTS
uniref:Uncharacterized protein n=1 Tax=Anopheles minimus TaxID=112268 RepID=A0A182VU65_9DIPT